MINQSDLKYIMKVTAGSLSFANTVKDITNHTDESAKVSSVFQKLLMRNITEHDLSRTEALRIALGMDFVFYSRQFRRVNLMGLRMVVKDDGSDGTVRKATKDNRADLYWRRDDDPHFANLVKAYEEGNIVLPWHPREINLYQYVAYFEASRAVLMAQMPRVIFGGSGIRRGGNCPLSVECDPTFLNMNMLQYVQMWMNMYRGRSRGMGAAAEAWEQR